MTGVILMKTIQLFLTVSSLLATTALVSLCLSSCNTTRGLGRDVQSLGQEIQQEAAEHTHY